ncbi:MAG: hypothetical protein DRP56_00980 [Planctomycetota bacterium]|nr:MAG: hypothetical protein DRP56_00980 [Planctomycetota bacterium]
MPKFRIPGEGKKTGRARSKVYTADTLEDALEQAYADETIVDIAAAEELPGAKATEKQKRLCSELGIRFPDDTSREYMTNLIDQSLTIPKIRKRYERLPPTKNQLGFAKELGIEVPKKISRNQLSALIDEVLDEEDTAMDEWEEQERDDYGRFIKQENSMKKQQPTCQLCGGVMKKKSVGRSFLVAAFFGLCFIVIGILLCLTGVGALFGIPLILIGLFYGSKRRKVLKCVDCGGLIDRG